MGLIKAVTSAIKPQHAPATSGGAIATTALNTSVKSIEAIAKGSVKNAGMMASVIPAITGKVDQGKADSIAERMGRISHDAATLAAIEPVITKAAGDYIRAETARTKIAKTVGAANRKVAVLNAQTQAEGFMDHMKTHAEVSYWQAAHGGSNFSV